MFSAEDEDRPARPIEAGGRVRVEGADGWYFLPFEPEPEGEQRPITLVSDDGTEVSMTLPGFVQRGDELAEIARLIIRARERWRDLKGLGA